MLETRTRKRTFTKHQVIFLVVWWLAYVLTLEFFRFRFGIFTISAFAFVIGILLQWLLFGRRTKPD